MNDSLQTADTSSSRTMAIVTYVLFLVGWPTFHLATVAGVILAYVQRDEARGTIWESHFANVISTFWIALICGIAAGLLCIVGIGFLLLGLLVIWFLYRTIRGLVHAIDSRPY